jgi:tRNA(Ile)-lysidine synthase
MIERIHAFAERRRMFFPGCRVGVAVSGGADSVCLLHLLRELAPRWNLRLEVLHLDHGLRGEASRADAEFVRRLAAGYRLPFHLREAGPLAGNLEEAGRQARRRFFLEFIEAGRLDRVALGHTRNDQAETLLFRLLRGAGSAGLAAMRPVTREGLVRPLLDTTRAEVEAFLKSRGLEWRDDATNTQPVFARNRIRHELLPRLEVEWNPRLVETLARTASLLQDDETFLEEQAGRLAGEILRQEPGAVILDAERLRAAAPALAGRVVRRAVGLAKGDLKSLDFGHIDAVLELASQAAGDGRLQVPGLDVIRSFDRIRMAWPAAGAPAGRNWSAALRPPCQTPIPGGKSLLRLEILGGKDYTGGEDDLDGDRLGGPLRLRNWRPGDHYRRRGRAQAEKVKYLFQEARIPLWERRNWPIITMKERVVWAWRFGASQEFAAQAGCAKILRVSVVDQIG